MSGEQNISIEAFKELLKQSIVQFDNEREHPHAKCEMAMRESYHELRDIAREIQRSVERMEVDTEFVKDRQNVGEKRIEMLEDLTKVLVDRVQELEEWQSGFKRAKKWFIGVITVSFGTILYNIVLSIQEHIIPFFKFISERGAK